MNKVTQKNKPFIERKKACLDAGFYTHRGLHEALKKELSLTVPYSTMTNTLYGNRLNGEEARKIIKGISILLKQPISTLWPEIS